MLGHQRGDERLLACLLLHADLLLVPADQACWWLPAECVELASLPGHGQARSRHAADLVG
jgi:hypothetical protein